MSADPERTIGFLIGRERCQVLGVDPDIDLDTHRLVAVPKDERHLIASKATSVREYIAAARADAAAAAWQFETSIVHHARNVVKTYRADASIVAVAHAIEELARALGMDP